jgi:predicted O-methyltransferase YrrM
MNIFSKSISFIKRKLHESYSIKVALRKMGIEIPLYPSGHYYSANADVNAALKIPRLFESQQSYKGIDLNIENQLQLLNELKAYHQDIQYEDTPTEAYLYYFDNPFFSYSDATILHCIIRHFRPQHIIEIGSGYSTACMIDTILHNQVSTTITAIDPEMTRLNNLLSERKPQNTLKQIAQKVQEVDQQIFTTLKAHDILFIDSSHVSKVGSELNYLLFEILPILNSGVIIHFHDIFNNFQYPKEWIQEGIHFNEQYLLRAFLQYNHQYEILLFTAHMEDNYQEWYKVHMPICLKPHERYAFGKSKGKYIPHIKGQSLYIRKL